MTSTTTFVSSQLAEARAELVRADGKATTLFAVIGLAVSAVLAGVIGGNWDPTALPAGREELWWIGCALAAAALTCLGAAVFPRTGAKAAPGRARYFKEIVALKTEQAVKSAIQFEAERHDGALDRDVNQLLKISEIVMVKYRLVRCALILYPGALACGFTAVLV